MLRGLLLILAPLRSWQALREARPGVARVLFLHLIPLLCLTGAAQAYGLVHWGEVQAGGNDYIKKFPVGEAVVFAAGYLVASILAAAVAAWLIKSAGQTFHSRHDFREAFVLAGYGLSPLFLVRILDAHPAIMSYVTWPIGIFLVFHVIYTGLPLILDPDPPQAFGLFVTAAVMFFLVTGLMQLFVDFYLRGRFPAMAQVVTGIASRLPF